MVVATFSVFVGVLAYVHTFLYLKPEAQYIDAYVLPFFCLFLAGVAMIFWAMINSPSGRLM
jgi:hypothetical protein